METDMKKSKEQEVERINIFPKEDLKMANRYMIRFSPLLIIRIMRIKTTMRHRFTPVRMAIIKTIRNNNVGEDVKQRNPLYTAGGNVNWCSRYPKLYRGSSKNYK